MKISDIRPEVYDMAAKAQERLAGRSAEIDRVAEINTRRVMEAFQNNRVAEACFAGTTGYGYDDLGRETLDKIYAEIFGTEAALVRIGFVNGTHALTAAMSLLSICAAFAKYFSGGNADPERDMLLFTNCTLLLTDGEFSDFLSEINEVALKYMKVEAKADSKTRQITLISAPVNEQEV